MRGEDLHFLPPAHPSRPRNYQSEPPEVVDPGWLLKAAAAVVAVGLLCSYIMLCVFFSMGQWQFVLHPSRTVSKTPAALQLAFTPVRFGDDVSGQPQLTGWWIPSDSPADPAVIMLHSQTGSMSDALPAARALHDARLNVLLFDYRGYGQSSGRHPSQALMQHDATSAVQFVQDKESAPAGSLLVYGEGLGASLAVNLAGSHPAVKGIILVEADGDTLSRVEADQRSRIVPIGLLFHERFPLADPLSRLRTPKLLISYTHGTAPLDAQRAADPKITAELPPRADSAATTGIIRRFLDSYITHPPATLSPTH